MFVLISQVVSLHWLVFLLCFRGLGESDMLVPREERCFRTIRAEEMYDRATTKLRKDCCLSAERVESMFKNRCNQTCSNV